MTMKKVSLLVSLLAFIFIASVSTSYAQSTSDKVETEKSGVSTSKTAPAAKAPCSSPAKKKCSSAKKSSCCAKSTKSKSAAKNEDAVIEEKNKKK